jgi:hypothetical protein
MSDRERESFFSTACDYYIAGRFAAFSGLNPVVGNLLHHAIEMYLKGALAKTKSLTELDKSFKHDLPKLWEAFKEQTNDAELKRFDATIEELHRFEDIRYPDSILAKGMVEIVRSNTAGSYKSPAVPEYRVCVQDIDELVEAAFSAASFNPRLFFGRGQPLAREFLTRENRASRLTDGVMQPNDLQEHISKTYFLLRAGLGGLAFFFPILLLLFGHGLNIPLPTELSAYYWLSESHSALRQVPLRGLFVGVLWAIGCFLILYKGFSRAENRLLNIAGFAALMVAIFPMHSANLREYCLRFGAIPGKPENICGIDDFSNFHTPAAIALFICMGVVAWACSQDTLGPEFKLKRLRFWRFSYDVGLGFWRRGYNVCAALMIVTAISVLSLKYFVGEIDNDSILGLIDRYRILIIECVGILAFAGYWLLKTIELVSSDVDKKAMETDEPVLQPVTQPGFNASARRWTLKLLNFDLWRGLRDWWRRRQFAIIEDTA